MSNSWISFKELFKRYAEVKLREKYEDNLIVNYQSGKIKLKPDFIIKDEKTVISTQYRPWLSANTTSTINDNYQFIALAARDIQTKEILGLNTDSEIIILSIYSSIYGHKTIQKNYENANNYTNIYKFALFIPIKDVK